MDGDAHSGMSNARDISKARQGPGDIFPELPGDKAMVATMNWTRRKGTRPRPLMPIQVTEFRRLLKAKKAEIIRDMRGACRAPRDPQTFSDRRFHAMSAVNINGDQSDLRQTLGLMDTRRRLLGEIDAALARLDDDTYGECEVTGKPIPLARLLVMPWTRCRLEVTLQQLEHHHGDSYGVHVASPGVSNQP